MILACAEPFWAITKSPAEGVPEEDEEPDEEEDEFGGSVLPDDELVSSPRVVSAEPDTVSSPVVPVSL